MNLYWIKAQELRLAIVARPRGGDWLLDDLKSLKQAGIEVLVSLLTGAESHELGLLEEAQCCKEVGIVFLTFPIEDRAAPSSFGDFSSFTELADSELNRSLAMGFTAGPESVARRCLQHASFHDTATNRTKHLKRSPKLEESPSLTRSNNVDG